MSEQKIQRDLKDALRARDAFRLSVLRMVAGALQSRQIEKRAHGGDQSVSLTEEEVLEILKKEVKKRLDAVAEYTKAGRGELAEKEKLEAELIQTYLPAELDDEALRAIIQGVVKNFGAIAEKDFGKIMGMAMKETKGRASGDRVQALVKKIISG